jgi:hypothetical protein
VSHGILRPELTVTNVSMVMMVVSAVLFVGYGALCLFSGGMKAEFERFGLSRFRRLTGGLEIHGGAGLVVGLFITEVAIVASGGLALLMLLGVIARLRVHDPLLEILPAGVLMVMNVVILLDATGIARVG